MAQPQSPLVGYNTNVRHQGKLYHIQTEDSGVAHPHVITHLFADGGRIIASRKTSYAEYVNSDDLATVVRKLMQEQHKAMFIELRDCVYDEDGAVQDTAADADAPDEILDLELLERAAAEKLAGSVAARSKAATGQGSGHYKQTVAAYEGLEPDPPTPLQPTESVFGGQLLQGKSLDDVILSYLADDVGDSER